MEDSLENNMGLNKEIPPALGKLFPDSALITPRDAGGYGIECVLENGLQPGDQKVELQLSPYEDFQLKAVDGSQNIIKLLGYRIESLQVNAVELYGENSPDLYFLVDPHATDFKTKVIDGFEVADHVTYPRFNLIVLSRFKTGDDVLGLLHEKGHAQDIKDVNQFSLIQQRFNQLTLRQLKQEQLKTYLLKRAQEDNIERNFPPSVLTDDEKSVLVDFITEEVRADNNALDIVRRIRSNDQDLFPSDPDLERTRASLRAYLNDYVQLVPAFALEIHQNQQLLDFV